MKYSGQIEDVEISDLSLDYIRGFLHCFSVLNEPNSTLGYSYDILKLNPGKDLVESLKKSFEIFKDQQLISLSILSKEQFTGALKSWLFESGEIKNPGRSDDKIDRIVSFYTDAFFDIINPISVYRVDNLSDELSMPYDLGVAYEYFVLETNDISYLLCFRYDD